jgi:thiosulfate/3-mercaptopyruvate sulfurtransferase
MPNGWTTVVQAEVLSAALERDDLAIVDCRFDLVDTLAGERAYREGHVPGAVHADLDKDLSDHRKRGQGRHPWPEAADFTAKLGAWGISPAHQVVAYDAGDGAFAARLWFLLRGLGHEKVAVLDGGWNRWVSQGHQVETRAPTVRPTTYEGTFDPTRLLDADDVQARLDAGFLLLDARAPERFRGEQEPLDKRAGHVPGATNRPYAENLENGRFKTPSQLADEFRALLGDREPAQVMAMCGSGVTACHHLLAMERAGLKGAALYTGSWSGWITDPDRPVATADD